MRASLWAVAALCIFSSVHAIFEEQAGQYDWHRTQIGKVTSAKFAFRSRSRVYVTTDAGVVAALDLRDGSVIWRQVLEEDEPIEQLVLLPKPAAIATLSGHGRQAPRLETLCILVHA